MRFCRCSGVDRGDGFAVGHAKRSKTNAVPHGSSRPSGAPPRDPRASRLGPVLSRIPLECAPHSSMGASGLPSRVRRLVPRDRDPLARQLSMNSHRRDLPIPASRRRRPPGRCRCAPARAPLERHFQARPTNTEGRGPRAIKRVRNDPKASRSKSPTAHSRLDLIRPRSRSGSTLDDRAVCSENRCAPTRRGLHTLREPTRCPWP